MLAVTLPSCGLEPSAASDDGAGDGTGFQSGFSLNQEPGEFRGWVQCWGMTHS